MAEQHPLSDGFNPILQMAFEGMQQGFCLLEKLATPVDTPANFRYLSTNPAFEQQSGLQLVGGKTIRQVVPGVEELIIQQYDRTALTGESIHIETYVSTLDRWMDIDVFRIREHHPPQIGVLFSNITERKKADQARQASEANLRAVFESLPVGIGLIDAQGKVTLVNLATHRFLPTGIIPSLDDTRRERWQAYQADGTPLEPDEFPGAQALRGVSVLPGLEMYYTQDNGVQTWTRVAAVPIEGDGSSTVRGGVAVTDVNELKQAEEALKEADARKNEFLAMLAHELRNPMATLRNGLNILQVDPEASGVPSQVVGMMNRQLDHLVRLVDDLLDVSRISQGKIELKRERVELGALVAGVVEAIRPVYTARHKTLHLMGWADPLWVDGDTTRLSQLVSNLLTNGVRYTGEQGQVRLSLRAEQGQAVLQVADNGIGLARDQLTAIFEFFVQVDTSLVRSQGGLGIGLTLAQRLAKLHGGWIEVHSPGLGQGSDFVVYLPLLAELTPTIPTVASPASSELVGHRLLVIDDNADAALTLSMLLKFKGYAVTTWTCYI